MTEETTPRPPVDARPIRLDILLSITTGYMLVPPPGNGELCIKTVLFLLGMPETTYDDVAGLAITTSILTKRARRVIFDQHPDFKPVLQEDLSLTEAKILYNYLRDKHGEAVMMRPDPRVL